MNDLSINAQTLLAALKTRSLWEGQAIDVLFPPITYSKETAAQVWQRDANYYGFESITRPVNDETVTFTMNTPKSLFDTTYEALKELKAAGLAQAKNNGYNEFSWHYSGSH